MKHRRTSQEKMGPKTKVKILWSKKEHEVDFWQTVDLAVFRGRNVVDNVNGL